MHTYMQARGAHAPSPAAFSRHSRKPEAHHELTHEEEKEACETNRPIHSQDSDSKTAQHSPVQHRCKQNKCVRVMCLHAIG